MKTTVIHIKDSDGDDVYIGRPSKWGNPYKIGVDGTREEVIAKYREWLHQPKQAELFAAIKTELKGKRLACYCTPLPCHGDVLAEIADADEEVAVQLGLFGDPGAVYYSHERRGKR